MSVFQGQVEGMQHWKLKPTMMIFFWTLLIKGKQRTKPKLLVLLTRRWSLFPIGGKVLHWRWWTIRRMMISRRVAPNMMGVRIQILSKAKAKESQIKGCMFELKPKSRISREELCAWQWSGHKGIVNRPHIISTSPEDKLLTPSNLRQRGSSTELSRATHFDKKSFGWSFQNITVGNDKETKWTSKTINQFIDNICCPTKESRACL